jgi:hypothetical protein
MKWFFRWVDAEEQFWLYFGLLFLLVLAVASFK